MNYSIRILLGLCVFFLPGCKDEFENIPIDTIRVIDLTSGVCSLREVAEKRGIRSKWVADRNIAECDGLIGITPEQFKNLQTYSKQGK